MSPIPPLSGVAVIVIARPAIVGGRIYCRWSLGGADEVVAFDAASGEMLWSTHGDAVWDGLAPIGDPAADWGRVYVLATRGGQVLMQQVVLV